MDIFNEVKEAVLSATPGEDTRNYYRNQGMKIEQERIIKLLDELKKKESKATFQRSYLMDSIPVVIALIKGEK